MKVLYDLISIQQYVTGGGEYVKKVLNELSLRGTCEIIGIYNSQLPFIDNDADIYCNVCSKIIDIHSATLEEIVKKEHIDVFFIGIIQRFIKFDINKVPCKIVAVIHDLGDIEVASNRLHFHYEKNFRNLLKVFIDYLFPHSKFSTKNRVLSKYRKNMQMLRSDNFTIVTVSNHTKWSIKYYLPELRNKHIHVFYPPVKDVTKLDEIENTSLQRTLKMNCKYILMVSAGRSNKNAYLLSKVFDSILEQFPDMYLVFVGSEEYSGKNIISLGELSASDLEILYKNAFVLVYPSLSEGFGYPPLEVMKYGIPVLSSNVCSMPEVLDDSVIYFSPFYENDLYHKLSYILENREKYISKSCIHANEVKLKQDSDLNKLIELMTQN